MQKADDLPVEAEVLAPHTSLTAAGIAALRAIRAIQEAPRITAEQQKCPRRDMRILSTFS